MKDVLIISLIYLLGAFVTKAIITLHDNRATLHYRVDDCDIEMMAMWFIALPLMLIAQLFYIIHKLGQNLGDWLFTKLNIKRRG